MMNIVYYDGSELRCQRVLVVDDGKTLVADDIYIVPIAEVRSIETED